MECCERCKNKMFHLTSFFCLVDIKMYAWQIAQTGIGTECDTLIQTLKQNKRVSQYDVLKMNRVLQRCDCGSELKAVFNFALSVALGQQMIEFGAILEVLAAIAYAHRNDKAGGMHRLNRACEHSADAKRHAMQYLCEWSRTAQPTRPDFWFEMRSRIMDAYTIACMFCCSEDSVCFFYGGDSHVDNVRRFLQSVPGLQTHPLSSEISSMISGVGMLSATEHTLGQRRFILLGEDHTKTTVQFAKDMLQYLKSKCHTKGREIVFLVEKHISNGNDPLQKALTCNQKVAIHRFRCDTFVEHEVKSCSKVRVVCVDNRHYDLGFVRFEIFQLWNRNHPGFVPLAQNFYKRCLEDLRTYCGKE